MTEVAPGGALPKPWTDLQNARKQRKTLREEIEKLNAACQAEDGSKHLVECEKCYPKSLSIIESAYTEPALKTWLTDRPGLKDDLKACIQTVMAGEANLDVIETRLEQEKNAWYRELLLASPDLLDVGDNDIRREDLLASLADPECHIDDIVNPMWESISKPDKWSDQLEAFIEKTSGADGDDAALRQIYADELFKNRTTGEAVAHAQPYLDAYEGNAGSAAQPLDEVLESLIRDISAGKSSGSQRTILRSRLDELSRAKTAFEQNKVTEAKGRSAAGVREAVVLTLLEPLPPCYTCEGEVKKTEVLSCSHCQIALQLAGEQGREKKKLTVFCSEDCLQKGQVGFINLLLDIRGTRLTLSHSPSTKTRPTNVRQRINVHP